MDERTVPVESLLIDAYNPRFRDVSSQAEALKAIQGRLPEKVLALARSIAEYGLSPIDRILVMENDQGKGYIVLEGNRRVAALKLLRNPSLCRTTKDRAIYQGLQGSSNVPSEVTCALIDTRTAARPWLLLRHGGELDGAGTVRWSTGQRQRFAARPGTQEYRALAVLDWLEEVGEDGGNGTLVQLVDYVFDEKLTTFGRLITDPDFRTAIGFQINDRDIECGDDQGLVVGRLTEVMQDLQEWLTVTDLRSKEQRTDYVTKLSQRWYETSASEGSTTSRGRPGDDDSERSGDASGSGEPAGTQGAAHARSSETAGNSTTQASEAGRSAPRNPRPRPAKLFYGLRLRACRAKTRQILSEVQDLDLSRFPNSAAVMTRSLVELVVGEAIERCGWQTDRELKRRIHICLTNLDPSGKNNEYKAVRNSVSDPNSTLGAATLNAFVHNESFLPTPTDLRDLSANYIPLLRDLHNEIENSGN